MQAVLPRLNMKRESLTSRVRKRQNKARLYLTGSVGMDDVVTRRRQGRIQESRDRDGYHVLLPKRIVPPVYHSVVRLKKDTETK